MLSFCKSLGRSLRLSAVLVVVLPGVAGAADRSFSLGPAALHVEATATQGSTVNLPKSGLGAFRISFVVPLDHAINTPITVRVYMLTSQASCVVATRVGSATRHRAGQTGSSTVAPNVDRITPGGEIEETAMPASTGAIVAKTYTVRTPLAGPFAGLRSGDGISIRIDRDATQPNDTCATTLFVTHVDVRYTSTAATP